MRGRLNARLVALVCAGLVAASGCGGDDDGDEVTLGADSTAGRIEQNEDRIHELEERIARARTARRERSATASAHGSRYGAGMGPVRGVLDPSARTSFSTLAESMGGEVGLVVGSVGAAPAQQMGTLRGGSAWSTIKVPIAAQVIDDAGGVDRLPVSTRNLIASAITASDNGAAADLWDLLAAGHGGATGAAAAVEGALAAAGDSETVVSTTGRNGFSPYGQTDWALSDQQRYMARFGGGCATRAALGELRSLMLRVIPEHRWGLGSSGAQAYFKGGWGPGIDGRYLVRQMGVIETDDRAVAVALAVIPADGQFPTATSMLDRLARWVVDHLDWKRVPQPKC